MGGFLVIACIPHGRCRLSPVRGCPGWLPHLLLGTAEVAQSLALAVPVAGLPADDRRVPESADRLLEPPHLLQRRAEAGQRRAHAMPVTGLPEDRRRFPKSWLTVQAWSLMV